MQKNYKIGLKLWSINTDYYYHEAKKLYDQGFFDYIELYVVPNTLGNIEKWKKLSIPYIIHCPHFMHEFNLADKTKRELNKKIYDEVKNYADILNASYIIFHGGMDGTIEETVFQLNTINDSRALIENKPYIPLAKNLGIKFCRGATVEEIIFVLQNTSCGFCLDFCHAICSANWQKLEPYHYVEKFNVMKPCMYHLSDIQEISSPYDSHYNFGKGQLDFSRILSNVNENAIISIETEKKSKENLEDYKDDVVFLKRILSF